MSSTCMTPILCCSMASTTLPALSLRPPEFSASAASNHRISAASFPTRGFACVSFASASPEAPGTLPPEKLEIELEFFGPNPGDAADRATAISGEKLLRNIMLDNKIELYAAYGKVMNCGGGGSCGTCIVEIIDGKDLLNERTNTEMRYLKKKPESWRLACQTIVGNKEKSGKVVVQRLPQWKK